MKILAYATLFIALLTCSSCDKILLNPESPNDPIHNFEVLWNDYDQLYGGFITKNINWDELYNTYRPMITESSSDEELYSVITQMLTHLNDNHVFLYTSNPNLESYTSGIIGRLKTFSDYKESTVKNNYLTDANSLGSSLTYGKLDNNLGYIHFNNFNESEKDYASWMPEIVDYLENTDGLIIDIRNNEGGTDPLSTYVAGYFTTQEKLAFSFRLRNGPAHTDFTEPAEYYLKPSGNKQYVKDIVVLTHRFTISAAETFTLTMDRLDHVTILGDTTSGAFSDAIKKELPNGWGYGVSVGDWRDFEGTSFEGIGFPPEVLVQNDSLDVVNGIDQALEEAMMILD